VLHGRSPYVAPTVRLLAQNDHFVYPQPFAYLFAPLALVPERVGALVFLAASVAAVVTALRLLGVRDWRCYGAALLTVPVFGALGVGSIGPLLALLVAAGWRNRDRPTGGILVALAAAAKLFLWPLLVWLLVTRRFRALAASARWALPLLLWATPHPESMGSRGRIVLVLTTLTLALLPRPTRLSGFTSRWADEPPLERAT
jgi:alpha-1,2-mannosyltransferase